MKSIFQYVLKNFELYYEFKSGSLAYGFDDLNASVVIRKNAEDTFFRNKLDLDFGKIVRKEWKDYSIPFCFESDTDADIITIENGRVVINYDVIASSFYFLSGWNEYLSTEKDDLGRSTYAASAVKALNIIHVPVVNYYFDIIYEALLKVNAVIKKRLWNTNDFAVNLTHDIDTCFSAWTEGSVNEFRNRRFRGIPGLIFRHLMGNDDWFNFNLISSIDKQFARSSTFFFLPRNEKAGKYNNADYNISAGKIRNAIKNLIEQGHEIGVHGGFGTHDDASELNHDILKLNTGKVISSRFHFLMFDSGKTIKVLEKNNIFYDTTLGFAENIGFRRSICGPFYLYDFIDQCTSKVLEIPLIVMDATLHDARYMDLTKEKAFELVISLINETKKHGGVFTILWHNNYFSDCIYEGWRDIYLKILAYSRSSNALITNGIDIFKRISGK